MPDVDKLLNAIDAAEATSYGADRDGELSKERARAIDLYLGKNLEPAPEGRSQVVDRSVFETIQWILPSLISIFANGDDVVELPPIGEEDEEPAKQEAAYLNHIILNKNPWLEVCMTWFIDAMLTKNAYVYAYRDTRRTVEVESYERQTAEGLALLLQDKGVQVISQSAYPDPEGQMEPVIDPATGQPAFDPMTGQPALQPVMLYDVELRRTTEHGTFTIEVLPPERCKISEQTPTFRVSHRCPYFEYYEFKTLSDLRSDGFDVDDDLAADPDVEVEEDDARDQFGERDNEEDSRTDPAMKRVKVRTVWIQHDYDEDGIAEMQRCVVVGKQLLDRREVGRIHVASIVPLPLPHRHIGLSVADIVADLQRIKTAILRGGLDNLYLSNNARVAVSNKVNLDDVLISRPGQPIRVDSDSPDIGGHVLPVVTPFVFPQAMEGLEYMDQIRENRTGTNRYFTGIDQNAMNKTATGIQQLTTMAAQRVTLIARIFACGIEDLFSILHELVLKSGHKSDVVKLKGKWVPVDPAAWKKRTDFRIAVGYAAGNKDAQVARLTQIGLWQKEALMAGLPIVKPENLYETAVELTKASDFSRPERFWTDPSQIPPQPPQPPPEIVKQQMQNESNEKIKGAELQQKDGEAARTLELEKYKVDVEAATKLRIAQMQHELDRERMREEMKHQREIESSRQATTFLVAQQKSAETKEART